MKNDIAILTLGLLISSAATAQTLLVEGLQLPQRLIATPAGNLLVSEGGTQPNTGRVSLVDRQGNRRSLLEGLPSAPGQNVPAFGPTGMGLDGRTLYLLIGEGDVMVGPPFIINSDGPSLPIFSSVLQIRFSTEVDRIASGFQLTVGDHWVLIDGKDVYLENTSGDRASIHLLTTFRLVRNILGGVARARPSDPYGAFLDASKTPYTLPTRAGKALLK